MSDENVTYIRVSAIKNVWLRRLAIVATFPLTVVGHTLLVLVAALRAWVHANASAVMSGAEQWKRKDQ